MQNTLFITAESDKSVKAQAWLLFISCPWMADARMLLYRDCFMTSLCVDAVVVKLKLLNVENLLKQ